jgi:hypothetical protein
MTNIKLILVAWPFCKDYNSSDMQLQNSISSNSRPIGGGRKGSTPPQYLEDNTTNGPLYEF